MDEEGRDRAKERRESTQAKERGVSTVLVARRLASAIVAAVAPKLFGSPCKLITTFKSSNISRRSSLPTDRKREEKSGEREGEG